MSKIKVGRINLEGISSEMVGCNRGKGGTTRTVIGSNERRAKAMTRKTRGK